MTTTTSFVDRLEAQWKELCDQFLPVAPDDSFWRYSRLSAAGDPEQGWKLHLSATTLSASLVLQSVGPYLQDLGLQFKAPATLLELKKLNGGLFYGFSQVGKFITVYPRSPEEAVAVAQRLHELTAQYPGPAVPYDLPFAPGSRVHYRYGAFSDLAIDGPDGVKVPAIRNPAGELVPDRRDAGGAVPDWMVDPFVAGRSNEQPPEPEPPSPLQSTIRAFEALSQRGKGGVYRALDLSVSPARLCILKEGRKDGETDWDGRDGYWRVQHESAVLSDMTDAGIPVPAVFASFSVKRNYYLAMEFVEGQTLQNVLLKKIPVLRAIQYGAQIAELMGAIHQAGWVWRDCKPLNLVLTADEQIRPLDFEGACPIDHADEMAWGTHGYLPPEWIDSARPGSRLPEDLYALGATLHQLLTSRVPVSTPLPPIGKLRRGVPLPVKRLIAALLDPNPAARPAARIVAAELRAAYQPHVLAESGD